MPLTPIIFHLDSSFVTPRAQCNDESGPFAAAIELYPPEASATKKDGKNFSMKIFAHNLRPD
jgi:hypothetical protein